MRETMVRQRSNRATRRIATSGWAVIWNLAILCILSTPALATQVPLRHVPPVGQQINRIPQPVVNRSAFNKTDDNDFQVNSSPTYSDSDIVVDSMVRKARFEGYNTPVRPIEQSSRATPTMTRDEFTAQPNQNTAALPYGAATTRQRPSPNYVSDRSQRPAQAPAQTKLGYGQTPPRPISQADVGVQRSARTQSFAQSPVNNRSAHNFQPATVKNSNPSRSMSSVPVRDSADYPWAYRLSNLNYQQFEAKLAAVWGNRLLADLLDNDQRSLRIYFPESKVAPETSMRFDRVTGMLTYEGPPSRKKSWHVLMRALDYKPGPRSRLSLEVFDTSDMDQGLIRQISHLTQGTQDPQDETVDFLNKPQDLSPEVLEQFKQQVPDLSGEVELIEIAGTGTLMIKGAPNDVAIVKNFLQTIIDRASTIRPNVSRIQLFNSQPTTIAESVEAIYNNQYLPIHGPVDVAPVSPSFLFVAGSPGAVEAVKEIARGLDGPEPSAEATGPIKENEKGYVVYKLQHISARTAKRIVDEFFGQSTNVQNTLTREPASVTTIVEERTNSLTVIAGPELQRQAAALIMEVDVLGDRSARRIARVFPIKNQIAGDFAVILQDIINGGIQQNPGLTESQGLNQQNNFNNNNNLQPGDTGPQVPLARLQMLDQNGQLIDGGVLFDVRITSNNASNSITVTAPEQAMPLIAQLIEQLDRLPNAESEVKVFPIVNGDAQEILATLEALFTNGAQGGGGNQQTGSLGDLPLQSNGSTSSSLLNIRFAINERLNTIIVSGGAGDLEFVESLIYRLDEKTARDRQTYVYRLSNAPVTEVATALITWRDDRQTIFDGNPLAGGGNDANNVVLAQREIVIVEEVTSNSLIINARPEFMPEIEHIIRALDRRPPMIRVKAMIVDVNLNQLENFGVEFGLQDSSIFDAGLNSTIGTDFVGLDNVAGQLVSELGVGRASSVAGISGLLLSAGDESLNFVLRFLKQKGIANVLFRPEITTVENLEGRVNVGASIQRVGAFNQQVGAGLQTSVENVNVGITLAVTPRVSPDGMIVMFVEIQNSALGAVADGTVIGTDTVGNQIISQPINQTVALTTIMARSGQTVALTGLIQEEKSQIVNSIPFLGELPVVGPIFQSVENSADRSELVIILTPYIVDGAEDISAMNEDIFDRMHWCKCDVAEIYGDTSYSGKPYREQTPKVYYPDSDPQGRNPVFENEGGWDGQGNGFPQNEQWREGSGDPENRPNAGGSTSRNNMSLPADLGHRTPHGASRHGGFIQHQSTAQHGPSDRRPHGQFPAIRTSYQEPLNDPHALHSGQYQRPADAPMARILPEQQETYYDRNGVRSDPHSTGPRRHSQHNRRHDSEYRDAHRNPISGSGHYGNVQRR